MTANEVLAPVEKLAGERETDYGNNTTVNTHYGAGGAAYCGMTVEYGFEMSGNAAAISSCPSVIWVPTFREWASEHWQRIDRDKAQYGDVFFLGTRHTGFIYSPYDGNIVITLEGNADVYATAAQAESSAVDSGGFEGIGYKKRRLTTEFRVYRPPYTSQSATQTVHKVGVDVSVHNGPHINWKKVKSGGVDFAIIRIGYGDYLREGEFHIESCAEINIKGASEAGLDIGFYWFSYAATAEESRREADFFCDYIDNCGVKPNYPVCFDYEYNSEERSPAKESIVSIARAFLKRVKERGYYPCNYTNIDYLDRGFDQLTSEYDTWLAQWGVSKPTRDCTIWQYTSTGYPVGFDKAYLGGRADMDICFVDYPAIIGGDTPKPEPTPEPTPKEDTCMVECKVIKSGSKGDTVKSWQVLLNAWGYSCGTPDGIFGGKTESATKKFQGDYGLHQDGIVGSATWGMMLA